jgi:prepilin-type N-terminal cleavage/methylation domain-containing protein/prepilin-type processing-associated H-X9-DG protein
MPGERDGTCRRSFYAADLSAAGLVKPIRVRAPSTGPTRAAARTESGFSLTELLVVLAIIAVLAALLIPALIKAREQSQASVCKNNMRQLGFAMILYADDNSDVLPWPGDVDRNWQPDWVFGGQPNTFPNNPLKWRNPDFGLHAESGSIFTYATGYPRVLPHRDEFAESFRLYRCPGTGPLGDALRVNFSMNQELDPTAGLAQTAPAGVKISDVLGPSQKILLVNEDPEAMRNASFKPDGAALSGQFILHEDRVNVGFIDGHLEAMRHRKVREIQTDGLQRAYFDPYYR